jgi:drug/metabolite transporter (DMT)-like permease
MNDTKRGAAYVALLILAVLWGYNWVVMKIATQYAPPVEFAAMRLLIGAALLFAAMLAMRKPLKPERLPAYFWIGVFQSGGFIALATWAVISAGAGKVSILSYTMPLWVAILAWPLLGERLHRWQAAAVGVAATGIVLILDLSAHAPSVADGIAILAGISWAIGVIITKRVYASGSVDVLSMTAWQMLFGGIVVGLVAFIVPESPIHWTGAFIGALSYNAVLSSALAYVLFIFVLRHLPAREASMGTLSNPIIGIIAAWAQLGEKPSGSEALGMLLVVAALAMLALAPGEQQRVADNE